MQQRFSFRAITLASLAGLAGVAAAVAFLAGNIPLGLSLLVGLCAGLYAVVLRFRRQTLPEAPVADTGQTAPATSTMPDTNHDDELYIVASRLAGHKTGDAFRVNVGAIITNNRLNPLSAADIDRLAAEIDRRDIRSKSFRRTPAVALVRMRRHDLDVDTAGTSWLGGVPTLADVPWPRDGLGRAMHHLAQIDLSSIPDPMLPKGMPRDGALAFFMTVGGCPPYPARVIYLPQPDRTVSMPPDDLAPFYDGPNWADHIKGLSRDMAPDTFPRWPVEFAFLPLPDAGDDSAAREYMADMLPQQTDQPLSPDNYRDSLPDLARPLFWDSAHRVTMSVRIARDELDERIAAAQQSGTDDPDLERAIADRDDFSHFVDDISLWAVVHEPWDNMTAADAARLTELFAQVAGPGDQARFAPIYTASSSALGSLQAAMTDSLVAATNAPPDIYRQLPQQLRDDIDLLHRLPGQGRWHQMFGLGARGHSGGKSYTHHHLLLQLQSDQLLRWSWGDGGIIQFWITEDNMLAQNWDAVEVSWIRD